MTYQSLLTEDSAAAVLQTTRELAEALEEVEVPDWNYAVGDAGIALFFNEMAHATADSRWASLAAQRLDDALRKAGDEEAGHLGFFVGLTGLAWVCHQLSSCLGGLESTEVTADVDESILEVLDQPRWVWETDVVFGLVGLGRYGLDHPNPAFRTHVVDNVVRHLKTLAEPRNSGYAWHTKPSLLAPHLAKAYPEGCYDLGMAHGVAGIIAFLGEVCSLDHIVPDAAPLLRGAMGWLLEQRRSAPEGSVFSGRIEKEGVAAASCRSAWCYGDPGIGAAFVAAGRGAQSPEWERIGLDLVLRDLHLSEDAKGIVDACLCHGAAGYAHLYHRLYRATGHATLARHSRAWFQTTLEMRNPNAGIADYLYRNSAENRWDAHPGLLAGVAGIGLSLLSAHSSTEPTWDRPFMLAML